MRISVIMPSFLGDYPNAATNREEKFTRALKSFWNQDYYNKELIIVADGCPLTAYLTKQFLLSKEREYNSKKDGLIYQWPDGSYQSLGFIRLKKQAAFSGAVRNAGIKKATGNIITYLDCDDIMQPGHLNAIATGFTTPAIDWLIFNDKVAMSANLLTTRTRDTALEFGRIGCSNIAHRKNMNVFWPDGYGHDWGFIQQLGEQSKKYMKIDTPGILVCHIPGQCDF